MCKRQAWKSSTKASKARGRNVDVKRIGIIIIIIIVTNTTASTSINMNNMVGVVKASDTG